MHPAIANNQPVRIGATPPHNLDAEQAFVCCLLHNEKIYHAISEMVYVDDFYHPAYRKLYELIAKTIDAGKRADHITLQRFCEQDEDIKQYGGKNFLADLYAIFISAINAKDYAQTIHDLGTRRRLLQFAHEAQEIAFDHDMPDPSSEALLQKAETKLYALSERGVVGGAVDMLSAFNETALRVEESFRRGGALTGLSVGLQDLDNKISGLQGGCLYTLAGRASMGKTAAAMTMAVNAAQLGAKTLFFSMEMPRTALVSRIIARYTGIPTDKQNQGLTSDTMLRIFNSREQISALPIYIDDTSGLTFAKLRGRCLRQKRRYGLDVIFIDYLGLMGTSDPRLNRNYQIEEITKGLKSMAKELNIPVVLLAQVNRAVEGRDDKRPMLSDLRDSGSIEQDSDVVMFVYRHEYYLTRSEPNREPKESDEKFNERYERWCQAVTKSRGKGEIIISKNRQGETGTVHLKYEGWKCLFTDDVGEA